jgi:uncharacterized protein involved in exopolysaccharide biosynthesis
MTSTGPQTIKYPELKSVLNRFLNYFISQYKLVLYITLISTILGFLYGKFQPSSYKATTTFIVEDKSGKGAAGLSGLASQFGIDPIGLTGGGGAGLFDGDNVLEIIKSRGIIEKVLLTKMNNTTNGQTIADYYIQISDFKSAFESKNINTKSLNFIAIAEVGAKHSVVQDSILYILYSEISKNLTVEKRNKKSTIITLQVASPDQVFSKTFAEELTKQTSDLYIDIKTGNLSKSIERIQKKADSLQNSLVGIFQNSFQINMSRNDLSERDKTFSSTLYAEVVKNLETLKLSLINQTPVIQVIDTPKLPLFDQRLPGRYFILIGFAVGFLISILYALYKYTAN